MKQGLLIALEGVDGSGTTSQRELVATALRAQGHTVHTTAEPSTGPIGKLLRMREIAFSVEHAEPRRFSHAHRHGRGHRPAAEAAFLSAAVDDRL